MACETCRTLVRAATTRTVAPRTPHILSTAPTRRFISSLGNGGPSAERLPKQLQLQPQQTGHVRHFSRTSPSRFLQGISSGTDTAQPYFVVAATERLFKICGAPASYSISAKDRKKGVKMLSDGEEMGQSTTEGSIWHESKFILHIHFLPFTWPLLVCFSLPQYVANEMDLYSIQTPSHVQHLVARHHVAPLPPQLPYPPV